MEKRKMILCDTNVFIGYFRGEASVVAQLEKIGMPNLWLSSITVAEIYYGMKKTEKRKTTEMLNLFNVIHFDTLASEKLLHLMLGHLDRKISLPDAMIAATAIVSNARLFTYNRKDFDYIRGIKFYNPK